MKDKVGYRQLSPEGVVHFKRIERRSSFRASLRRMGYKIGGRQTGENSGGPSSSRQVDEERYAPDVRRAKLPVVSLYAAREDMRFIRRKASVKETKPPIRSIKETSPSVLSPNSRIRVDRLVKKLGPEAFDAVKRSAVGVKNSRKVPESENCVEKDKREFQRNYRVRKPLEPIPLSDPPKRRRSLGNLLDIDEENCETASLKSNVDANRAMEQGRVERQKKIPPIDIHLTALFAAVEHGHVDKAKTILESTDVDVNGVNSDGLSPLDIAVLSNNKSLIKMLITFGAQEGNEFSSGESLLGHLRKLSCEADQRICELAGQDTRNQSLWQRRSKGLANMIMGFTQARPPDIPSLAAVDVTGSHMVNVRYHEPESSDSPPCTKYKIEWSQDNEFRSLCGYRLILDPKQQECLIDELNHGQRYYFRVYCGNVKGWGHPRPSTPQSVVPSSWRDVVKREDRMCAEGIAQLDQLFREVRTGRPDIKALQDAAVGERRKKTTIKQLFTAASKFQKNLRRGVYLSCLLYHEDKVLVTNEDFLPTIEVDETYPGSIYHDFHWLLKVACTWDDVKWLRQDMEKSLSSPAIHFRIKLLQAAAQMQTALSVQDLGQLYHKPLRDSEGTIVISTVNYVRSPKSVSVLNSRWVPISKLTKRTLNLATEAPLGDILMSSISDQITYHQVSSIRLPRGLYLGYLKMRSSVDLLQVLVPSKAPNVLPHCKIRDNPHITAEEWECLTNKCGSNESLSETEQQKTFVEQVAATINRLLTYMQVSNEQSQNHRLYDAEVVEVSNDVSLLIVVPPPEAACSAPGQGETLLQRPDLIPLPVQVFEMVHLGTYHKQLVARYSRLSCIIELDTALAQHSHREAFSSSEVSAAKERLSRLEALQSQLNSAWKQARWLLDVLAFARDKVSQTPTNIIRHLLALHPKRSHDSINSHNGIDWGDLSLYCHKSQEEFDREASGGGKTVNSFQRTMSIIHEEKNSFGRSFDEEELALGEINLGFSQDSVEDENPEIPDYLVEQTKPLMDDRPYLRKFRRNSLNPQLLFRSQSLKETIERKVKPVVKLRIQIKEALLTQSKNDTWKHFVDSHRDVNHKDSNPNSVPDSQTYLNSTENEEETSQKHSDEESDHEKTVHICYSPDNDKLEMQNSSEKHIAYKQTIAESMVPASENSSVDIKAAVPFSQCGILITPAEQDVEEFGIESSNDQPIVESKTTTEKHDDSVNTAVPSAECSELATQEKKNAEGINGSSDKPVEESKTEIFVKTAVSFACSILVAPSEKRDSKDVESLDALREAKVTENHTGTNGKNETSESSISTTLEKKADVKTEKQIKEVEKCDVSQENSEAKPMGIVLQIKKQFESKMNEEKNFSTFKKTDFKASSFYGRPSAIKRIENRSYSAKERKTFTLPKSEETKNAEKYRKMTEAEKDHIVDWIKKGSQKPKPEIQKPTIIEEFTVYKNSSIKKILEKKLKETSQRIDENSDVEDKSEVSEETQLLLPPDSKGVKSRGSWPGPGVQRLLCAATAELSRSEHQLSTTGSSTPPLVERTPPPTVIKPISPPALLLEQPRLPPSKSEDTLALHTRVMAAHSRNRTSASATTSPSLSVRQSYGSGSLYSLSSDDSGVNINKSKSEGEEGATVPAPSPGILQVYAAYETGLASGTSLKLHVSPRTTAREVVDLVVKQLNMAVVLKGKDGPIYPAEQLQNFCLVAVIGARERCLRDDFKPLQLQNPWKKGRLYVRQKNDVLAALEQSSRHSAYL